MATDATGRNARCGKVFCTAKEDALSFEWAPWLTERGCKNPFANTPYSSGMQGGFLCRGREAAVAARAGIRPTFLIQALPCENWFFENVWRGAEVTDGFSLSLSSGLLRYEARALVIKAHDCNMEILFLRGRQRFYLLQPDGTFKRAACVGRDGKMQRKGPTFGSAVIHFSPRG